MVSQACQNPLYGQSDPIQNPLYGQSNPSQNPLYGHSDPSQEYSGVPVHPLPLLPIDRCIKGHRKHYKYNHIKSNEA